MSGLSQGSAKLFITSSNLVIASGYNIIIKRIKFILFFLWNKCGTKILIFHDFDSSSRHPGVIRKVLSGAFFFCHPVVFLLVFLYQIPVTFLSASCHFARLSLRPPLLSYSPKNILYCKNFLFIPLNPYNLNDEIARIASMTARGIESLLYKMHQKLGFGKKE